MSEVENTNEKVISAEVIALDMKLTELRKRFENTFLLARKRREFTTPTLAEAVKMSYALEEACGLMLQCLEKEEDRIDFANEILSKFETRDKKGNS